MIECRLVYVRTRSQCQCPGEASLIGLGSLWTNMHTAPRRKHDFGLYDCDDKLSNEIRVFLQLFSPVQRLPVPAFRKCVES